MNYDTKYRCIPIVLRYTVMTGFVLTLVSNLNQCFLVKWVIIQNEGSNEDRDKSRIIIRPIFSRLPHTQFRKLQNNFLMWN